MQANAFSANPIQIFVTIGVVALLMLLRMRRMGRTRPLRVEQLWIVPALFIAIAAFVLWQMPPTMSDAPWLIGAVGIGGVVGWYRGKVMRISVDPETHAVNQSASPWAMLLLLALIALRYGARYALAEEAQAWHIGLSVLTDAPLLLAGAMLSVTRVEMYIRAQKLLKAARGAKQSAQS